MDRRHELEVMHRSTAMVPPGQLAMRREAALQVLEELIDALQRLEIMREALAQGQPSSDRPELLRSADNPRRHDGVGTNGG